MLHAKSFHFGFVSHVAGGALLGAVGLSGDTSDNDDAADQAGTAAADLAASPG